MGDVRSKTGKRTAGEGCAVRKSRAGNRGSCSAEVDAYLANEARDEDDLNRSMRLFGQKEPSGRMMRLTFENQFVFHNPGLAGYVSSKVS